MIARVASGTTHGLEPIPVSVEVDVSSQSLPSFTIVGLPSKAVEESKERVRAAIKNSGATFPSHRITVNLTPSDVPKDGNAYDLPIALGILIASGQASGGKNILTFGSLSLDGSLLPTAGILPMAVLVKRNGYHGFFLPAQNAKEAAVIQGINVYPVPSLTALVRHANGIAVIPPHPHLSFAPSQSAKEAEFDLEDIKGQEQAKRTLTISAAGGHNLSMRGVPGAGKTMLARALPGILPDLTEQEALEVTKIYSVTGNIPEGGSIITIRPFRSPHHTTSRIGLIGGGTKPIPGEISLAHRGVLFLDEFPELPRSVLEALRQPIEDGIVTISRASGTVTYPAKFVLVCASNPCPCGFFSDPVHRCTCLPGQIMQYQKRVSGPITDRIDLHIDLPPVTLEKLTSETTDSDSSKKVKERVQKARNRQTKRYAGTPLISNSDLKAKDIKEHIPLSPACMKLLRQAVASLHVSARTYYRMIKVTRTIADLENEEEIAPHHIAEALQYRPKEISGEN